MRKAEFVLVAVVLCAIATTACDQVNAARTIAQGAVETRTVTGSVVCLVCYSRNKANAGADHDSGRHDAFLRDRRSEDERLRDAVEHGAEEDCVCTAGELLICRHALSPFSTTTTYRPVAAVEH